MSNHEKITFVQGNHVETLWAEPLGEGHYRIDNIPFEVGNISLGDIVIAAERDEALRFISIFDKSGASTFRIQVKDGLASPAGVAVLDLLKQGQLRFETAGDKVIAVNVPRGFDVEEFVIQLEMLRDSGVDHEQSDFCSRFAYPVAPGSPAAAWYEQRRRETLQFLEELAGEKKE